jgi:hypothetical protein
MGNFIHSNHHNRSAPSPIDNPESDPLERNERVLSLYQEVLYRYTSKNSLISLAQYKETT